MSNEVVRCDVTDDPIPSEEDGVVFGVRRIGGEGLKHTRGVGSARLYKENLPQDLKNVTESASENGTNPDILVNSYDIVLYITTGTDDAFAALDMDTETIEWVENIISAAKE